MGVQKSKLVHADFKVFDFCPHGDKLCVHLLEALGDDKVDVVSFVIGRQQSQKSRRK